MTPKIDVRYIFAYTGHMPDQARNGDGKLIFLGACLIAAVRLAREEKWDHSPRVVARISDSVHLAQRVYESVRRALPQYFSAS